MQSLRNWLYSPSLKTVRIDIITLFLLTIFSTTALTLDVAINLILLNRWVELEATYKSQVFHK